MKSSRLRSLAVVFVVLTPAGQSASLRDLTQIPSASDIKISPDGRHYALLIFDQDRHVLRFLDRESLQLVGRLDVEGAPFELADLRWANNERIVAEVVDINRGPQRVTYGEIFAVDFDGSRAELIFGYRSGEAALGSNIARTRSADEGWADIVDVLPNDDTNILVSVTPFSDPRDRRSAAKVLDIYTGLEQRTGKYSKYGFGTFYADRRGEIRFVTNLTADGRLQAESLPNTGGAWVDIPETLLGDLFRPIAVADDSSSIYVLDNRSNDKMGLHLLSLDGKSYAEVYTRERVDLTDAYLGTDEKSVYAVRVDDGYPSYVVFSDSHEEAATFRALLTIFPGRVIDITSRSSDGRYWVVKVASDVDPGRVYLYDKELGTATLLLTALPQVAEEDLARMEPIEFESFDGTRVAGYLTRGKPVIDENAPLVVLLHDGPRARDYWRYDAVVQALATNGYSVLQINFRGSSGYGMAFREAGDRQWADAIPRDIIAGAKWAIEQGKAEAGRVCAMGTGFGAYAALESAMRESELFACVIAKAGIYDLKLLLREGLPVMHTEVDYLNESIARSDEELERASPVNQVALLDTPVLVAHDKSDTGISFEHTRRLRQKLEEHEKEYEWLETSRKGLYDQEVEVEFLEAALEFLGKHTGASPNPP